MSAERVRATTRVCYACGAETTAPAVRCDCGEPLWLPESTDATSTDASGMWRHAGLLPVDSPGGVADAVGDTPLVAPDLVADFAGVNLSLKLEGHAPTGSFKDRGSALAVAAVEAGYAGDVRAVGTVSHGNMAMSTAAFAASADLPCVVLVPDDIPESRLGVIAQYDPTIVRVDGDYGRLYERSLELGREHDIAFLNSDVPLRVEGQKTTAVEVCLDAVPDAIVMPVSSGGHASGAWKAVRELHAAGRIDQIPELHFVQASPCAPIAAAFERGDETVAPVDGKETIAYSIANADPPSGNRVLAAARDTGGTITSVDDDATRAALETLAQAGISVETSCAVALAGTRKLVRSGRLAPDADVTAVMTGTGLKDASGSADTAHATVDRLDAVLDEVGADR
jgi:threonine synthase